MPLDPVAIIEAKRDGKSLTPDEIDFFVQGYVRGDLPDYQMAALLMAVAIRGMNSEETAARNPSFSTLSAASAPS